jgi:hypothetical protein
MIRRYSIEADEQDQEREQIGRERERASGEKEAKETNDSFGKNPCRAQGKLC